MIPFPLATGLLRHLIQATLFAGVLAVLLAARPSLSPRVGRILAGAAFLRFLVPLAVLGWGIPLGRAVPLWTGFIPGFRAPVGPATTGAAGLTGLAWIALVWATGAVVCGVILLGSAWKMRRRLERASEAPPAGLDERLTDLARSVGVDPSHVRVVITSAGPSVGVDGFFRSRINVPRELLQSLAPDEIDAVLLHELVHVRRRDNLCRLVPTVTTVLFWFHPLVWWLHRRFVADGERACDDEVVRLTRDPRSYASGLVKAARSALGLGVPGYSGMAAHGLNGRVNAILQTSAKKDHPMYRALLAGILLAGFVLTSTASTDDSSGSDGYRIDQLDVPPKVVHQVPPDYPAELREHKITGTVVVEFVIDKTGQVTDSRIISSPNPHFAESVTAAVRQWTFTPGMHQGRAVNTRVRQALAFNLP
ncbi:MAG TPA: TonB family protein [Candidatus Didemnitutus sp.]|nr:TonB family protein [Candidatus Didemnitutus sp.]